MDRKFLVTIHMYLAAFFAPAVLLVAISGGLYLVGVKGTIEEDVIYRDADLLIDPKSESLRGDVFALLGRAGVTSYSFEYVKVKGDILYTRPTSSDHYIIHLSEGGVELVHAQPSLQSRMIELHKGHGPTAFKTFQQAFAIGLICIMLSGLWLGLSSTRQRLTTAMVTVIGTAVFALLLL